MSFDQALAKTRGGFLGRLFGRGEAALTAEWLDSLEEALLRADLSVSLVDPLMAQLRDLFTTDELKTVPKALTAVRETLVAALEQLERWAERVGVPIVSGKPDGDPAAVVFDAVNAAASRGNTTVIADTAGRLHTKGYLMDELGKIVKVTGRAREGAPDEVLLVLDGTAGQNAIQQARQFTSTAAVTGLVVTKLDGTAKGGAVFAIAQELKLPVKLLGVGEKVDDLVPMEPNAFVNALLATN
jgi:fused signal recognition particle receptor